MVPEQRSLEQDQLPRHPGAGHLAIRVHHPEPRTVLVRAAGEVDLETARELDEVLRSRIGGDVDEVVVDLSGVTFFSVAGLNSLLRAQLLADTAGAHLTVDADRSRAVRRLFTLLPMNFDGVADASQAR